MVNTPAKNEATNPAGISKLRSMVIHKINKNLNQNIEDYIKEERIVTPGIIESQTLSHMGSLYGSSSNHWMSAFLRHPNFSSKLNGLYFVGGSVHPGGGIPLCLLSAKITSTLID
jgi:phytoene dehydrogenase-like protein